MVASLRPLASLSLLLFIVSAQLSTGMTLTMRQILEPWRNVRVLVTSFFTSFLVVPLLAFGITWVHPLEKSLQIGVILLSVTAGNEGLPKITEMAKGNSRYAVGLMAMQIIVSVACVPFLISLFLPGVAIERSKLVMKLILLVFLPLSIGLFVNARNESAAKKIEPVVHKISTLLLVAVFALTFAADFEIILSIFRLETILVAVCALALPFVAGFSLGGPGHDMRMTLGIGSTLRSASIAMMFAGEAFNDPKAVTMILLIVLMWLPVLLSMILLSRRAGERQIVAEDVGSLSQG